MSSSRNLREKIVQYMNESDLYILLPAGEDLTFWPELLEIACEDPEISSNGVSMSPVTRRIAITTSLREIVAICDYDTIATAIRTAFDARCNHVISMTNLNIATSLLGGSYRRRKELLDCDRKLFLIRLLDLCVDQVGPIERASDGRASDGRASDGRASDGRASDGRASDGRRNYEKELSISFYSTITYMISDILSSKDARLASEEELVAILDLLTRSIGDGPIENRRRTCFSILKLSLNRYLFDELQVTFLIKEIQEIELITDDEAWALYKYMDEICTARREVIRAKEERRNEALRLEEERRRFEEIRVKELVRNYQKEALMERVKLSNRLVTVKGVVLNQPQPFREGRV